MSATRWQYVSQSGFAMLSVLVDRSGLRAAIVSGFGAEKRAGEGEGMGLTFAS